MNRDCLLCGVGGQGTVLASKLIASAAINRGDDVRTAETIGMAQRGGCVVSHVRWGRAIHSPMIAPGGADVIIAFEPAEAVRCLPYLKPGGTVVVNQKAVQPVTATLGGGSYDAGAMLAYARQKAGRVIEIDGDAICTRCGSSRVLNVALLGAAAAAAAGVLGVDTQELEVAIRQRVHPRFHELNRQALALGAAAGKEGIAR
ncbi:MAG: indolepyruvate oxidoreductase subunit beta [Eubacteriales bacterium]|nr:indolepyruvate oxidoreductase subunit beta [Eubacteriales bacterium]